MANLLTAQSGPKAVPFSYAMVTGDVAYPETISATFNGAGASGDFLACLDILSQDGKLLSRTFPDDAVTAGDTAEVTYAPFLRKTKAGIRFVTSPQAGKWLLITATGTNPATGNSFDLIATDTVNLQGTGTYDLSFDGNIQQSTAGLAIYEADGSITVRGGTSAALLSSGNVSVQAGGDLALNGATLSFFSVPGVAQQATPVTLGDVIALLQAYGLAA